MITNESFYFIFGLYLYIPWFIVWRFQDYFKMIRPDPVCQLYHTWAFPSMESMYIGAVIGIFVSYSYVWRKPHSWFIWLVVYFAIILPNFILIYTAYNRWWEVLFSLGFGIISSIFFVLIARLVLRPNIHYLNLHFPFYTVGYVDHMIGRKKKNESKEIENSLFRLDNCRRRQQIQV